MEQSDQQAVILASKLAGRRVYIAGPMSGLPALNRPAFWSMAGHLEANGAVPLHTANEPLGLTYAQYMDISLAKVRCAEMVLLLPGWEHSKGARTEFALGESLGLVLLRCRRDGQFERLPETPSPFLAPPVDEAALECRRGHRYPAHLGCHGCPHCEAEAA